MKFKPYDAEGTCPKCGCADVITWYCENIGSYYLKSCYHKFRSEHLHRACQRCHYEWHEACVEEVTNER